MIDITNKDGNGWKEILPDVKEWSISSDSMVAWDATYGVDEILAAQIAGTKLSVKFGTDTVGDTLLTGDVYVDSDSISAAQGSPATFSFSAQGTGVLTKTTVTT
jgi:predicted secreted protein